MYKTRRKLDWFDEIDLKAQDVEVAGLRRQVAGLAVVAVLNAVITLLIVLAMKGVL